MTLLLFFQTSGFAQEKIVLASGEWPPYTSKKLKHNGYGLHIVSEAFATQRVQVEYIFLPWKRAYIMTERGKFDGTALWIIDSERQKKFHFSQPVNKAKVVIFHRKDKPVEWSSYNDLKKYRIGITLGYSYGNKFHDAVKKFEYRMDTSPTEYSGFKKLLKERVDVFLADFVVGYWILHHEFPTHRHLITNNPNVLLEHTIHLMVSKKQKGCLEKVNTFNKGLDALKASGKFEMFEENLLNGFYGN